MLTSAATTFLAGYAGKQRPENMRSVTVYSSLPVEQASILANEYERVFNIRVNLIPMSPADLLIRLAIEKSKPGADVVLADAALLQEAKKQGTLAPYVSEQTDIVPVRFKDKENYWTGVWYDIFILAANQDYLKILANKPTQWLDLTKFKVRLAITDFLAADAAARLFFTLTSLQGEDEALKYFAKLHRQIVQYSKFLATPVRMAAIGEADIAIALRSEALRYQSEGFPITLIYLEEGTAYMLTAAGLTSNSPNPAEGKAFLDWLLSDAPQNALSHGKQYFISTNPETASAKAFSENNPPKLLDVQEAMTADQQRKLLDRWVQTVRLAPR
ncbi:MAG: extracellular solute-binding protein [Negativicutes bacterium]|nr:extracellular solute-binding protein [Negativicutes bacterium]